MKKQPKLGKFDKTKSNKNKKEKLNGNNNNVKYELEGNVYLIF